MLNETLLAWNDTLRPLALWLANYWLHSTVLLSLAWLTARFLKSHAQRELLWKFALVAGVATCTAQLMLSEVQLTTLNLPAAETASRGEVIGLFGLGSLGASESAPTAATAFPWVAALVVLLVGVWLLAASALLVRFVLSHRKLRRALANRTPLLAPHVLEQLQSAAPVRGARVTQTSALSSPVALGTNEICVPDRFESLREDEQLGMLAHEYAHLLRRDQAWLTLAHVLERVFFFQPLQRLVRRNLQVETEHLCDAWAAEQTGEPLALARCLTRVAEWIQESPQRALPGSIPAMAAVRSTLVTRVEALLCDAHTSRTPRARAAFGGLLTVTLLVFACAGPRVVSEESDARIEASIVEAADITVSLNSEGLAQVVGMNTESSHSLHSISNRAEFHQRLEDLAFRLRITGPDSFLDRELALEIVCEEGTPSGYVLQVMQACASQEVAIADIRFIQDGREFAVPLPADRAMSYGQRADRVMIINLVLEAEGEGDLRAPVYSIGSIRWGHPFAEEEEEIDGMPTVSPELVAVGGHARVASLNDLRGSLDIFQQQSANAQIIIDARKGTLYSDVVALLDEVIGAGFSDILFVGRFQ